MLKMCCTGKPDLYEIMPVSEGLPNTQPQISTVNKWEILRGDASQWDIQLIKN